MRIAVIGAGGVGGYFGGRLALSGEEVTMVARGRHLDAIRANGLRVESTFGDFHVDVTAVQDPGDIGPVDVVLVAVKSQDTQAVAGTLDPLVGSDTAVVSLQNGLGNEEVLGEAVGLEHVLGGVAYILSTIGEPGLIVHKGGPASIVFGELDGTRTPRAIRLHEVLVGAGIAATLTDDIRAVMWDKFALICALSGVTAAIRLPIGEIRSTRESWDLFRAMLREAAMVAEAERVELPAGALERQEAFASGLEPGVFSSLHYDLTHDKPMELESLQGALLRRARAVGVPVPMTEAVYAILKPWEKRTRG
jgi:2-dehydropantoate 2-reductase